jgi:hypothetical protein
MNTVLHIGNHKTGTKMLQHNFFSNIRSRRYLGTPLDALPEMSEVFDRIIYQDSLSFDPSKVKALMAQLEDQGVLGTEDQPVLISNEVIVTPFLGGRMTADPSLIAERLHKYFGPTKILYMIRSQRTMLAAMYTQFTPHREVNQKAFEIKLRETMDNQLHGLMHAMRYDKIASVYASIFGKENVKVIPFELLVNDPASYYETICNFIGEPFDEHTAQFFSTREHERITRGAMLWERMVPHYENLREKLKFGRLSDRFSFINPGKIQNFVSTRIGGSHISLKIPTEFEDTLERFFGPSNQKIQNMFGLDLKQYNYPMGLPGQKPGDEDKDVGLGGWSLRRF